MRATLGFLVFILFTYSTSAQQLRVISSVDSSPLPYATVTNHTHPLMYSSDKNGVANLTAQIGDSLSISYVGYKTQAVRFNGKQVQVVNLLREPTTLPTITLRNCTTTKEFKYKNLDMRSDLKGLNSVIGFGGVVWSKAGSINQKAAIRLNPSKAQAILEDFSFWIFREPHAPKSSVSTPLMISFYEVSDSTHLPGDLISKAPIFYFPKKEGKQTIKLDSLHLRIPDGGIYVSLQYIMNEEYEWKEATKWKDSIEDSVGRDTVIIRYGGRVDGLYSSNFTLAFYNGNTNKWIAASKKPIPNNDIHGTIKCEATIKYCEDE